MSDAVVGKLAAGLRAEAPLFCAWVVMNEPAVAEALAREAFDAVVLDLQHGMLDFVGASRAILSVALAGKPTIVRAPVGEFSLASRLLDAGAAGVIAPMVNSREDARRLAAFTKFPPLGERSWGPRAVLPLSGLEGPAYLGAANAMTQTIAMIETRAALDALDDILEVEGVDGVFIGPSDLSIALNDGAQSRAARRGADEGRRVGRRAGEGRTANTPRCSVSTGPTPATWPQKASASAPFRPIKSCCEGRRGRNWRRREPRRLANRRNSPI